MSRFRAVSLVRDARALVMSIPDRISQLRDAVSEDNTPAPDVVEPAPGGRRRLVRQTILSAAQSLRAPIIRE